MIIRCTGKGHSIKEWSDIDEACKKCQEFPPPRAASWSIFLLDSLLPRAFPSVLPWVSKSSPLISIEPHPHPPSIGASFSWNLSLEHNSPKTSSSFWSILFQQPPPLGASSAWSLLEEDPPGASYSWSLLLLEPPHGAPISWSLLYLEPLPPGASFFWSVLL